MLPDLDIENVYIYIADAIREDFIPPTVAEKGMRFKTVAAGIQTPTSVPSLLSGTYLPQHHVGRFQDSLPDDVPNLLHRTDIETCFANTAHTVGNRSAESPDLISGTLNADREPVDRINDISPPFAFVERALGGHAPYTERDSFKTADKYYSDRADAPRHQFAREYRAGVEEDTEQFLARLETLDDRGLLEDTLVIYTSDHGEFLGEQGSLAHVPPIHPSLVYVPTVFIHPSLPASMETGGVLRHVDILSTVSSLLDWEWDTPITPVGVDITRDPLPEYGYTFYESTHTTPIGTQSFAFDSVWNFRGGYVLPDVGPVGRAILAGYHATKAPWRGYVHRHPLEYAAFKLRGDRCHGAPEFSRSKAKRLVAETRELEASTEQIEEHDVSTDRLRELGYIE